MPLPPNFGTWEHLQRILMNLHNYRVRDYFKEGRYDRHIREPKISTPVSNIMQSCIIRNDDSAVISLTKIVLFEIVIGNAARLQPGLYGIPRHVWDEYTFEGRPRVFMYFEEDISVVPTEFSRVSAEVSFRLMDESAETMTTGKAEILATRVKAAFGAIPTWDFNKGKDVYTYLDKKNGYDFQIYALQESDAEQLIRKTMSVQNHNYEVEKLKKSEPKRRSDPTPGFVTVMGKRVRKRRFRPEVKVRFRYATLLVPGLDPIVLYDPYRRLNSQPLVNNR